MILTLGLLDLQDNVQVSTDFSDKFAELCFNIKGQVIYCYVLYRFVLISIRIEMSLLLMLYRYVQNMY